MKDLILALLQFSWTLVVLYTLIMVTIGQWEIRKTQFGWRASGFGRLLNIHSQAAHPVGFCWCQTGK